MATVTWDGGKLTLYTEPRDTHGGSYYELDRLCAKLKRQGFRIARTGQGNKRYATPIIDNPKLKRHPRDYFTVDIPIQYNG